jgi:hypothetical protein
MGSRSVNGCEWKFENDEERCLENDGGKKPVRTSSADRPWICTIAAAMNIASPAGVMAKFNRGEKASCQSARRRPIMEDS